MSKTRVIEAVKRLDLATVADLLDANPELLGVKNRQGRNLLHLACSAYHKELKVSPARATRLAGFLLDRGMDIEELGMSGRDPCPPLFFAVAFGRNAALVRFLLARGARIEAVPGGGLFAAAWWNDTAILDLLLGAGAPIDVVVGVTPFLAAWCWKNFDAAKLLARRGANVNFQDGRGKTALHHGVEKEYDPSLLRWLVRHGASPDLKDRDGVSPRMRASRKRNKRFAAAFEIGARVS